MTLKILVPLFVSLVLSITGLVFYIVMYNNTFDVKCLAKGGIPTHNFQSNVCFKAESIIDVH
jgi:hypothetical protein